MEKLHISDLFKTLFVLAAAYKISDILLCYTGVENNSALIYALAVLIISRVTDGYLWGIAASIFSAFCINYYFMYPYAKFNMTMPGYTVAVPDQAAGPGCHPPGTAHPGAVPDEPAAER